VFLKEFAIKNVNIKKLDTDLRGTLLRVARVVNPCKTSLRIEKCLRDGNIFASRRRGYYIKNLDK